MSGAGGPDVGGTDAVAVVGMAGRFPGADDPTALWRLLLAGQDAIRTWTDDELRAAGVSPAALADPAYVRASGRLDGIEDFDAALFGYTPAEAALVDPQQRIFLEVAWAALEDAGYDPRAVPGAVGVYAGAAPNRYLMFHLLGNPALGPADPDDWESRIIPGSTPDYLPTRVSYKLGLTGPSVAVQTACSSSLVAVCTAAQSLLDYRCDAAVAGGVALTSTRPSGYRAAPGGTTAPDGVPRAFDAAASGTVYGNGAGAVVLKLLDAARDDGDHVYAVLTGFAVTNDGAARAGFTAPGTSGQAAAVVEALASAELDPADVGYVEAHASGTRVGDALEVAALTRAFRSDTPRTGPCALGAVKNTVGNLDAAAGVTGLVKAVFAVRAGVVPATVHVDRPNPELGLDDGPFVVPTKTLERWPVEGPRVAGVSSFGQGGTNAHVLVAEAPPDPGPARPAGAARPYRVLPVSAATPEALRAALGRLADRLADQPETDLDDVAWTLALGRHPFAVRAAVVCRDVPDAVRALRAAREAGSSGDAGPAGVTPARGAPLLVVADPDGEPVGWAAALAAAEGVPADGTGGGPLLAALFRRWGIEAGPAAGGGDTVLTLGGPGWVEVAPGPAVPAPDSVGDPSVDAVGRTLAGLATLWVGGYPVDWAAFSAGRPGGRTPLPTYPFARTRCWIDPPAAR